MTRIVVAFAVGYLYAMKNQRRAKKENDRGPVIPMTKFIDRNGTSVYTSSEEERCRGRY